MKLGTQKDSSEIYGLMTDPENYPPQFDFDSDIEIDNCGTMKCIWYRNGKCGAGTIHIDKDGHPDKCP